MSTNLTLKSYVKGVKVKINIPQKHLYFKMSLSGRNRSSILDKPLSKGKGEVSLSCFALLFSEVVQYCQNKSQTVPELQNR